MYFFNNFFQIINSHYNSNTELLKQSNNCEKATEVYERIEPTVSVSNAANNNTTDKRYNAQLERTMSVDTTNLLIP